MKTYALIYQTLSCTGYPERILVVGESILQMRGGVEV